MTRPSRLPPQPPHQILAAPLTLMAASLAGLALGLTGDGWRDLLSAALLILPLTIFVRHWHQRGQVDSETTAKKKVHP